MLCSFSQVPDSFARRQDLKKEEAACCVRFPPLLRQIYYIFRRKANVTFRVLTFARAYALARSAPKQRARTLWELCIPRSGFLRSLFHDSHPQGWARPLSEIFVRQHRNGIKTELQPTQPAPQPQQSAISSPQNPNSQRAGCRSSAIFLTFARDFFR